MDLFYFDAVSHLSDIVIWTVCKCLLQLTGIAILAVGIWMVVELYKYMELSTEFSATAPYVLIGTGALIILVGSLACCCTVKGQPVLLYIVSKSTLLWGDIPSYLMCLVDKLSCSSLTSKLFLTFALVKVGLPYVRFFPDMSSFSGLKILSGWIFLIWQISEF